MEHQPMLRRIDGGNAAMMALVEQTVRRDDAVEILQRRPPRGRKVLLQIFRNILDDILLERRWRSVGLASHGIARRLHPLRDVGRQVLCIFCCRCFAAGETTRNDSPTHQGTAFAQKPPARCRDKTLAGVGWLGHRSYSARNRHAWNNPTKLGYVTGGRRLDYSSPSQAPLAEGCCACANLADPVPSRGSRPTRSLQNRARGKGRIVADAAFAIYSGPFQPFHLILRARSLAFVAATVISKERP